MDETVQSVYLDIGVSPIVKSVIAMVMQLLVIKIQEMIYRPDWTNLDKGVLNYE